DRDEFDTSKEIYFLSGMRFSNAPNENRMMIVARKFPPEISPRLVNISEQHNNFYALKEKLRRIKATYMLLLAAVAFLLVFSASWLALYVARGITVPIQSLAEATERIAQGDFEHPVNTIAEDELAALVTSFNQMARTIAENRQQLERVAEELTHTNQALD